MPWHVEQSGECPASRPWAVIKDDDGTIEGCHASETDAQGQLTALNIAESEGRAYEDINFNPPEGVRNEVSVALTGGENTAVVARKSASPVPAILPAAARSHQRQPNA